ncbi:MAG: heme o synthase [Gemmatimonadota bacterium]
MDDRTPNRPPPASRLAAFYELTKPGITAYVMITAGVSAYVASRGTVDLMTVFHAVFGTGLSTGGALALNQYMERAPDAVMLRTRQRPLPSGRLTPGQAVAFGALMLAAGLGHLAYRSGPWPAAVALVSAIMYMGVYTPLKSRSYVATLVGAVPGALPVLIGWTAARGSLELTALWLFAIAYLWQLPHVLGLAWMLREDYARVGFRLVPAGGGAVVGRHMVVATALLVPTSIAPTLSGYTGVWYAAGAVLASLAFAGVALRTARAMTDDSARRLFLSSLLYHPVLLGLMLLDTVRV